MGMTSWACSCWARLRGTSAWTAAAMVAVRARMEARACLAVGSGLAALMAASAGQAAGAMEAVVTVVVWGLAAAASAAIAAALPVAVVKAEAAGKAVAAPVAAMAVAALAAVVEAAAAGRRRRRRWRRWRWRWRRACDARTESCNGGCTALRRARQPATKAEAGSSEAKTTASDLGRHRRKGRSTTSWVKARSSARADAASLGQWSQSPRACARRGRPRANATSRGRMRSGRTIVLAVRPSRC